MGGRLLVVSGGLEAVPGIADLARAGYEVVVLDGDANAPGFAHAAERLVVSTYDAEGAARAAEELHARRPFAGALSIAADVPVTVATVQERLGLPGQGVADARVCADKLAMKRRFVERDVPTTWFREVGSAEELLALVGDEPDYLVKPVDSRGARGVQRLLPGGDHAAAYEHAAEVSPTGRVLLERFVPGPQLSTEALVDGDRVRTLAISDRNYEHLDRFAPFVIENGGLLPSRLYDEVRDAVDRVTLAAARALGVRHGVLKGDVVWTPDGPVLIEAAPRLSGGWLATDQVPLATGRSLVREAARLATGRGLDDAPDRPSFERAVAVRYLFPPPGRVRAVRGLDELRAEPWVHRLEVFLRPGDEVPRVTDHTRRAGLVIASGADRDEAERRAVAAIGRVVVELEPS